MVRRKIILLLIASLFVIGFAPSIATSAWYTVKPFIRVIVDNPDQILTVDLLVPVMESPLLLDEFDQPIDHPLNGYRSEEGLGSASLYSSNITLLPRESSELWVFESPEMIAAPFRVVIVETDGEIYFSELSTLSTSYGIARWTLGVFSIRDDLIQIQLELPPQTFHLFNYVPYLVVFLIAMIDFPLLFFFGYREKRDLLLGGLVHLGAILFLAFVNRVYHISGDMGILFIILFLLATFTIGEIVLFGLNFKQRYKVRPILVAVFGMFLTSLLLFLYMGSGVF